MATNGKESSPLKVMLWSNPRTLSTVFLKCMSFVEGTQCINEPYAVARVAGPEKPIPSDPEELAAMEGFYAQYQAQLATVKMDLPKAFSNDDCTFQWVKDTLEAPYPEKKLVFCKDQAFGIHGRFNMLPEGYRHTFLIRSPYKIYPSWRNVTLNMMPPDVIPLIQMDQLPEGVMPPKLGLGELYDLLQYVTENIDPKPIVIDADDLQSNPSSIMRQYCEAIGISFQESMLTWEKGDEITRDWIAASEFYAAISSIPADIMTKL
ncbi:uncharacterized protein [Amphiura filiformis]|uniref:uncharacterized protein n=1 Tax=Amphiura filiformis TaxID=82378 RepID=UPI003B22146B